MTRCPNSGLLDIRNPLYSKLTDFRFLAELSTKKLNQCNLGTLFLGKKNSQKYGAERQKGKRN